MIVSAAAKLVQGQTVSAEDKATIGRIQSGFDAFTAIDAAATTIIAVGDAANPIASAPRWRLVGIWDLRHSDWSRMGVLTSARKAPTADN